MTYRCHAAFRRAALATLQLALQLTVLHVIHQKVGTRTELDLPDMTAGSLRKYVRVEAGGNY
jgi:hypothetical protein